MRDQGGASANRAAICDDRIALNISSATAAGTTGGCFGIGLWTRFPEQVLRQPYPRVVRDLPKRVPGKPYARVVRDLAELVPGQPYARVVRDLAELVAR